MDDHDLHLNIYHTILCLQNWNTSVNLWVMRTGNRATMMLPHFWILPANSFKQFRTNDVGKGFILVVSNRLLDFTVSWKQETAIYNFTAVIISHPDLKSGERGYVSTAEKPPFFTFLCINKNLVRFPTFGRTADAIILLENLQNTA
jgi:hypothetical protein